MSNALFDNQPQRGNQGIFNLMRQLKNGHDQQIFEKMYQSNPQFRDFANSMKGKTPEQAFQEKGFNFNSFKNMIK